MIQSHKKKRSWDNEQPHSHYGTEIENTSMNSWLGFRETKYDQVGNCSYSQYDMNDE